MTSMTDTTTDAGRDELLRTLATKAHAHERAWETGEATALVNAVKMGEYLVQAKAAVNYGEWLPWLKANGFAVRQAQMAMRLMANTKDLSHLGITTITGALAHLTVERKKREKTEKFIADWNGSTQEQQDGLVRHLLEPLKDPAVVALRKEVAAGSVPAEDLHLLKALATACFTPEVRDEQKKALASGEDPVSTSWALVKAMRRFGLGVQELHVRQAARRRSGDQGTSHGTAAASQGSGVNAATTRHPSLLAT